MYACNCLGITEQQVRDKAHTSDFAFAHFAIYIKREGCCKCLPIIKELINEEKQRTQAEFTVTCYESS